MFKVCAIEINGGLHALVLDTVEKIHQGDQNEDYDIGDRKFIFKNTYDNEYNGQPRKVTINAKSEMSPDVFYFVHIDVDLDQIKDCTCKNIRKVKYKKVKKINNKKLTKKN